MNKKGFVFVETIITIVFLAAALLILYTSYRSAITEEKEKVYYDDIGYLYRNYYIADYLINKSDIYSKKNSEFKEKYIMEVTEENVNNLFTPEQIESKNPEELIKIKERFNVNRMLLVSDEVIVECSQSNEKCESSYEGLSAGLEEYIKTMEIEESEDEERRTNYYLVTEYREKSTNEGIKKCSNDEEGCGTFYVKLKLDINKSIENDALTIGKVCKGQNFGRCISENYEIENLEDAEGNRSGIFYHDGKGEDSGNGEKEAKDNSYRYGGALVNNWVCFGSDDEDCPEENMYRIIGVFGNNIKIIKNEGENKIWNSTETITKNYESKWKNMIISKAWNNEGMEESELNKDALGVYQSEMKGSTIEAKQGLMYVSEYMYSASPSYWNKIATSYSEASSHNWMYKGIEWTVSGVKGATKAYAINEIGNVGSNNKSENISSRISLYLKDTIVLASGEGIEENPFRLADIGIIINDLNGNEGYYDITVNVEAMTSEGKIVEYYYSIKKNGEWSEWEKDSEPNHKFEGLNPDTEYEVKVKALNSLGNYSEEKVNKFTTKYQAPTLTVSGSNANGNIETDKWTNKNLTVKGNTSGGIGGYDVYYCRTTENTCEPNTKGNSLTDSTEGIENICFRTVSTGARKTKSGVVCYKSKLDKTKPTCVVNNQSTKWQKARRTLTLDCSDSGSKCATKATTKSFTTTTKTAQVKYTIKDNAGNSQSCAVNANVYVDTTPPSCTINKTSTGNGGVSGNVTCVDNESGLDHMADYQKNGWYASPVYVYGAKGSQGYYAVDKLGNWTEKITFPVNSYWQSNWQCCSGSYYADCWWSCSTGWRSGSTCYYNSTSCYGGFNLRTCRSQGGGAYWNGSSCCYTSTHSYGASRVCGSSYCHSSCDYGWTVYY